MAAVHNGRVAPALMLIARVLRGALLGTSFNSTVSLYVLSLRKKGLQRNFQTCLLFLLNIVCV